MFKLVEDRNATLHKKINDAENDIMLWHWSDNHLINRTAFGT